MIERVVAIRETHDVEIAGYAAFSNFTWCTHALERVEGRFRAGNGGRSPAASTTAEARHLVS